jgi:type II secretory ATPase GspE/PulE/Tfp pilus assembly ATPase PilB-like protein
MSEDLYHFIHDRASESTIKEHLTAEGFRSLRQEGLLLVDSGKSTLEEVLRVTHMETQEKVRAEERHPVASSAP